MPDYNSNPLGGSIQTGELDDLSVTTAKIADGAVTLAKLDSGVAQTLAKGSIQVDSTAYNVDYVDISIDAGDLSDDDMIEIILIGKGNTGGMSSNFRLDILDVTTEGSPIVDEILATVTEHFQAQIFLAEKYGANDTIYARYTCFDTAPLTSIRGNELDTNDANVFTTSFRIRLNFKVSAAANTTISYVVRVIK